MHVILYVMFCNIHVRAHDHRILSRVGGTFLKFYNSNKLMRIKSTQMWYSCPLSLTPLQSQLLLVFPWIQRWQTQHTTNNTTSKTVAGLTQVMEYSFSVAGLDAGDRVAESSIPSYMALDSKYATFLLSVKIYKMIEVAYLFWILCIYSGLTLIHVWHKPLILVSLLYQKF